VADGFIDGESRILQIYPPTWYKSLNKRVRVLVFNNILIISWLSVLLVEKVAFTGYNNHLLQVTDKLYHIMLY